MIKKNMFSFFQWKGVFRHSDRQNILFNSSIMLLRKSRKHLHGASNRYATEGTFYHTFNKPFHSPKHELPRKVNITCSTSHLKKRQNIENLRKSDEMESHQESKGMNRLENQLKKMYQGRKNIIKAIDGWEFDAKGFISSEVFRQKLKEKLGIQPQEGEVQQILQKYCKNSERIDAKELIAVIHGQSECSLFNQTIFSPHDVSKQRETKIINLKQSLKPYQQGQKAEIDCSTINKFLFKINSAISKMKDLTDGRLTPNKQQFFEQLGNLAKYGQFEREVLKKIEKVVDFEEIRYNIQSHNSVDHLFLDPILRKTHITKQQKKIYSEQSELFINKMAKSATSSNFHVMKNSQKRQQFDPKTMFNINQQKTRFGMSKFTQQSEQRWVFLKENVSPNQKDLILQTIKSQADIHKQRHENRLQKLRNFQRNEGQSIAKRQQQAIQRQKKRLQRIRHEQQAYTYVNFLKKKWE